MIRQHAHHPPPKREGGDENKPRFNASETSRNRRVFLQCSARCGEKAGSPIEPVTLRCKGFGWCCQRGLNSRPLPYQGSALPLSYGSAPTRRAAYCHSLASCARRQYDLYSAACAFGWRGRPRAVQTSRRAAARRSIWASVWRGPGVIRSRSVLRGTVG
jgi:hypothetical protein